MFRDISVPFSPVSQVAAGSAAGSVIMQGWRCGRWLMLTLVMGYRGNSHIKVLRELLKWALDAFTCKEAG